MPSLPLKTLAFGLASCLVLVSRADVLYLTDVEGSRVKLETALRRSGDFAQGADGFWKLLPGRRFVYGGDAIDRYYGSLWVTEQLARLAEDAPERTVLLLGNRDGNKPRLTGELAPEALTLPPPWFAWSVSRSHPPLLPSPSRAERLRWILQWTMGAPQGFELVRKEIVGADRPAWIDPLRARLSDRLGRPVAADDDELVAEAYLYELSPEGALHRVLERSRLTWRDGATLYLHGGLSEWNFGRVPGRSDRIRPLARWQEALEGWYASAFRRWKRDPFSVAGDGRRAAEELVGYMMPVPGTRSNRRSVVTGRTGTEENMPWLPPAWVRKELMADGVRRLVLGHTPSGDAPSFVRSDDGFEVVCADNSYGFREDAATLLRVSDDRVEVETRYRDGSAEGVPLRFTAPVEPSWPLGRYTPDGELVVAVKGDVAVLYRMQNYRVSYREIPVASLGPLRAAEPADVAGKTLVWEDDFDPPTLGDRTTAAFLVERFGLTKLVLAVRPDAPGVGAGQHHRAEMTRRLFDDLVPDIEVIVSGRDAEPAGAARVTEADLSGLGLLSTVPSATGKEVRQALGKGVSTDLLHPDVRSWIRMHGLYRPLAPPVCVASVVREGTIGQDGSLTESGGSR